MDIRRTCRSNRTPPPWEPHDRRAPFGSSAGVAITNLFLEGRSVVTWLRQGRYVAAAYAVGFFFMLLVMGWNPDPLPAALSTSGH